MPSTAGQNRQTALAFYDLLFNQCKPQEAVAGGSARSQARQRRVLSDVKRVARMVAPLFLVVEHCGRPEVARRGM